MPGLTITVPDGPATLNLIVTATTVESSNGDTATTTAGLQVLVANAPPAPVIDSISTPRQEGATIVVQGSATDLAA